MAICPNCGNEIGEGAIFCDQCGTRLPRAEAVAPQVPAAAETAAAPEVAAAPASGMAICPTCGAGNVPGEAFCDYCGSPLEAPAPAAEAAPGLDALSAEAELELELPSEPDAELPTLGSAEPVAPPEVEAVPVPAPEGLTCPACGAEVLPGEAFCADCGASLAEPPLPPLPVAEEEPAVEEAAPVAAPPAAPEAAPPVIQAPPEPACPVCGAEVEATDRFCSNCGASLEPAVGVVAAAPAAPSPPVPGARLVVISSGAEILLPPGDEILIGREDPVSGIFPEVDLTPHGGDEGGVSRRHARLIREQGAFFAEDLNSTNFTFVNKQKLTPGARQPVQDGDEIRCGRVSLVLKTG
jgi:predicted amidophosphoribosyltransferase